MASDNVLQMVESDWAGTCHENGRQRVAHPGAAARSSATGRRLRDPPRGFLNGFFGSRWVNRVTGERDPAFRGGRTLFAHARWRD